MDYDAFCDGDYVILVDGDVAVEATSQTYLLPIHSGYVRMNDCSFIGVRYPSRSRLT